MDEAGGVDLDVEHIDRRGARFLGESDSVTSGRWRIDVGRFAISGRIFSIKLFFPSLETDPANPPVQNTTALAIIFPLETGFNFLSRLVYSTPTTLPPCLISLVTLVRFRISARLGSAF